MVSNREGVVFMTATGTLAYAPVEIDAAQREQLADLLVDLERIGLCVVLGAADVTEEQIGEVLVQQPHDRVVTLLARGLDDVDPGDVLHRATTLDPAHDTRELRMNDACNRTGDGENGVHDYDPAPGGRS
jgi:hypothetical protein